MHTKVRFLLPEDVEVPKHTGVMIQTNTASCATESEGATDASAHDRHQRQAACQTVSEWAVSIDQATQTSASVRAVSPRPDGKQPIARYLPPSQQT